MADVRDAGDALVQKITAIVYPNGTASPSITGIGVLIYQGWPLEKALTDDLAAKKAHVSVFPRPNDKVTSVYQGDEDWVELTNNGVTGTALRELRRQTRTFQIGVWASCFDARDPLAAAIDAGLAAVSRINLADGSQAIISYVNSRQVDDQQRAGIYRRDLFYAVNYATIQTETDYAILHNTTNATALENGATIGTITVTKP